MTYSEVAKALGVSRNVVAGKVYRARLRGEVIPRQTRHRRFRDEALAVRAVSLANEVGLQAAAKELGLDPSSLCRWRKVMEGDAWQPRSRSGPSRRRVSADEIRARLATGERGCAVARALGVSEAYVSQVKHAKRGL